MSKPLDKHYHDKKLRLVLRDLSAMPSDEYARALIRLANVADDSVICEPEFAKLRAGQEPVACHVCHGQGEVWTGENQTFGYMSMQPPEPIMEACPECGGESATPQPSAGVVPEIPWQWSKSLTHCWPDDKDDRDGDWCVGCIDEEGNFYEVVKVEASQYDAAGESQKIAEAIVALWEFARLNGKEVSRG